MWTRILFWKRKLNRIYTACPEIREIIDRQSRNTTMNVVRLVVAAPFWVLFLIVYLVLCTLGWLGEKMVDLSPSIMSWVYRDDKGKLTRQAHEILSPETIRSRINPNSDS